VTLSAPNLQSLTVNYATANRTATAGSDSAAVSGTPTFLPGVTSRTYLVTVAGDTAYEPGETFFVNLSARRRTAYSRFFFFTPPPALPSFSRLPCTTCRAAQL
jgi:hypothetical protein